MVLIIIIVVQYSSYVSVHFILYILFRKIRNATKTYFLNKRSCAFPSFSVKSLYWCICIRHRTFLRVDEIIRRNKTNTTLIIFPTFFLLDVPTRCYLIWNCFNFYNIHRYISRRIVLMNFELQLFFILLFPFDLNEIIKKIK